MIKWFFPKSGGGEEQGLNDAGMENFKSNESLGRETCQNIGDVRDNHDKPAIVTFELVNLPNEEFPGIKELTKIFYAAKDYVLSGLPNGSGNEEKFFNKAIEILKSKYIPILKISDENTSGLVGTDDDRTKSYYRLLRLQGSSSEQGVGGGTYGIGQRAPFAHSALRTIFYSSKTTDGDIFIAKCILASFPDPDTNEMSQSKGWWCNVNDKFDGWNAIRDEDIIPKRFLHKEIGTSLWVTGFHSNNWEQFARHSILKHFFASIHNKHLELRLKEGNKLKIINSDNLEEELTKAADEERMELSANDFRKSLGSTLYYHKALKEPINGKPFERVISKIGTVKLYVYRDTENNDMPERWVTMRKPQIIVKQFDSRLLSHFAAVLVCENDTGNKYLSQLEGPTHTDWSEKSTRNWSSFEKDEARKVINEITSFVRSTLKLIRGKDMDDQQDIPFLGRYLPAEDDDKGAKAEGVAEELSGYVTNEETGEMRTLDKKSKIIGVANVHAKPGINSKSPKPEPEPGPGPVPNLPPKADQDPKIIKALSSKYIRFRSYKLGTYYRLVIESEKDQSGLLNILAVGEDGDYLIDINSAIYESSGKTLKVSESRIHNVELVANKKISLLVSINSDLDLCLAMGE